MSIEFLEIDQQSGGTPVPRDNGGFFFSPVVRFRRRVFATSSPILEDCRSFMFLRSGIPELTRSSVVE